MKYWIATLVFVFAGLGEWAFVTWAPLTPELRRYQFTHLPGIKQYREAKRQKKFDEAFERGDGGALFHAAMIVYNLGDKDLKENLVRRLQRMDSTYSKYVLYHMEHGSSNVYPPEKERAVLIYQLTLNTERQETAGDEEWTEHLRLTKEFFEDLRQKADEGDEDSKWIIKRLIFPEKYWIGQESVSSG